MRVSDIKVMPRLQQYLLDPSVLFTNHFTPFPLCAPSRVGMLTGLQPHNHGVTHDKGADGGYAAYRPLEGNSLPVWLTKAGYYVGHIGKFINEYDKIAPKHVPPGYAHWRAMSCSFARYTDFTLNENGKQVAYDSGQYTTNVFVEHALHFLTSAPKPFALFLWPNCCHWPATPAPEDVGTFAHVPMPIPPSFNEAHVSDKPFYVRNLPLIDRRKFNEIQSRWRTRSECLQSLDRGVAAIMQAMEINGLLADTHVIFTSDNGFLEGEHRIARAKDFLYEEGAGTPLYWRQPSGYAAPCPHPVSNIDISATMVELSGATARRLLDGKSLSPILENVSADWNSATLLQSSRCVGIATRHYRYIEWGRGDIELYDMTVDRFQMNNKAGRPEYEHVQRACSEAMQDLLGCAGASCSWTHRFPEPPGV